MTRKIGRYEILGPLATGGMAEILLARLVGPSGFERPVVIKRIRQDLDHKELASLFIDEARLASKVRHANVVAVEDLGTDDGAPYLVMEYLEGENVSNVERRLTSRNERMPYGLAAYIVAEACAGLHAAHELRDSGGDLMGLVHRDVSPQNLFVTYGGAVKVVDFGIARTTESAQPTDPGHALQGKYAYMAPEQLRKEAIDRRTDVFALGVVLYELLTGHTLFRRFSAAATMRAVLSSPIVPVRRADPGVPLSLEAICARALMRDPDERYANAASMRRDLRVAMRDLVSEEPSAELAELMARSFPNRIAEKQLLVSRVREGSVVDRVPAGDVDVTVSLPGIDALGASPDDEAVTSIRYGTLPALGAAWPGATLPEAVVEVVVPSPSLLVVAQSASLRPVPASPVPPLTGASSLSSLTTETPLALPTKRRARPLALATALLVVTGGLIAARVVQTDRGASPSTTAPPPTTAPSSKLAAPELSAMDVSEAPFASAPPTERLTEASASSASSGPSHRPAIRPARPLGGMVVPSSASPTSATSSGKAPATAPEPASSPRGYRRFQ